MTVSAQSVERFFQSYAAEINSGNAPELVAHFADSFLVAGPQGAQPVRSADFGVALPKRQKFFADLGCRSTELASVEVVPLDSRYALARTRWKMTFAPGEGDPQHVVADSDYIVDTGIDPWKIVFYLANQDLMEILKERGIAKA